MWPHYSQEGGYLRLAADAYSVNNIHIQRRVHKYGDLCQK